MVFALPTTIGATTALALLHPFAALRVRNMITIAASSVKAQPLANMAVVAHVTMFLLLLFVVKMDSITRTHACWLARKSSSETLAHATLTKAANALETFTNPFAESMARLIPTTV